MESTHKAAVTPCTRRPRGCFGRVLRKRRNGAKIGDTCSSADNSPQEAVRVQKQTLTQKVQTDQGSSLPGLQQGDVLREPWVNVFAKAVRCFRTLFLGLKLHLKTRRLRKQLKQKDLDEDDEQEQWDQLHESNAKLVLRHIYRYQGFFSKIGQALSSKKGELPAPWVDTLQPLQNEMPFSRFETVRRTVTKELHRSTDELFSYIEEKPVASASVAQAHVAHLRAGGDKVCVKVQHEGVAELMSVDLSSIEFLLKCMRKFHSDAPDLTELAKEWRRTSSEEVDFRMEARNALDAFHALQRHGLNVGCCEPLEEYCSKKVLTMRFVEGWKITATERLPVGTDRESIGSRLFEAFAMLTFQEGLVHGDPHPGNVFVEPAGENEDVRPVFLDWGIVRRLTLADRVALAKYTIACLSRDRVLYLSAIQELGFEFGTNPDYQELDRFIQGGMMIFRDTVPSSSMRLFAQQRHEVESRERKRVTEQAKKAGKTGKPAIKIPGTVLYFFRGMMLLHSCCDVLEATVSVAKVILKYAMPLIRSQVPRPVALLDGTAARSQMESAVLVKLRELASEGALLGAQVAVLRDGEHLNGRGTWLTDVAFGQLGHTASTVSEQSMLPLLDVGVGVLVKCLLVALSRPTVTGRTVSLEDAVGELWPEFSQRGKGGTSIRRLLQHQAGLTKPFSGKLRFKTLGNEAKMEASVAASPHEAQDGGAGGVCRVLGTAIVALLRRATGHGTAAAALRSIMEPLGLQDDIAYHGDDERLAYLGHQLVEEVTMAKLWEMIEERQEVEQKQEEEEEEGKEAQKEKVKDTEKTKLKPVRWLTSKEFASEQPWCLDPLMLNREDFRRGGACDAGRGLRASARSLCQLYAADVVPSALLKESCTHSRKLQVSSLEEWEALGRCVDIAVGWQLLRFNRLDGSGSVVGFGHTDGTTGSVALRVGDVNIAVLLTSVDKDARHAGREIVRVIASHLDLEPSWPQEAPEIVPEPSADNNETTDLMELLRSLEARVTELSNAIQPQPTATSLERAADCMTGRWAMSSETEGMDEMFDALNMPAMVRTVAKKARRHLDINENGDRVRIASTTCLGNRKLEASEYDFTVGEEFQGQMQMGGTFKAVAKWVSAEDARGDGGGAPCARRLVVNKQVSASGRDIVIEETYQLTVDDRLLFVTTIRGFGEVEVQLANDTDRDLLARCIDRGSLRLKKDVKLSQGTERRHGRLVGLESDAFVSHASLAAQVVPCKVKLLYEDVRCSVFFNSEGRRNLPLRQSRVRHNTIATEDAALLPTFAQLPPNRINNDECAVLEGYAWKRSAYLGVWRKRWLVLKRHELTCFADSGESTLVILARDVLRVFCGDVVQKRPGCFCIQTKKKKFYFAVEGASLKSSWMSELSRLSQQARD
eukprot:TRINITY_DN40923_c0_g1_i1.p1 TRINITY_DN40923_c0_g1~~TRINITY_DN40923_c0_g1_i1.p1  ORF type:complete len:1391 (+),score=284.24 TRINITY_DN40923_c0_g1_i1:54-4226(+)